MIKLLFDIEFSEKVCPKSRQSFEDGIALILFNRIQPYLLVILKTDNPQAPEVHREMWMNNHVDISNSRLFLSFNFNCNILFLREKRGSLYMHIRVNNNQLKK